MDLYHTWDTWFYQATKIPADDSQVNLLVQVVAWYVVCNGIKCTCCHRPQLIDLPEDVVVEMYKNESVAWQGDRKPIRREIARLNIVTDM